MKVKLTLISRNADTGETAVLAEGPALFDGRRLLYTEKDTKAKHDIHYDNGILTITRSADVTSVTRLHENGNGTIQVISEFGTMELSAATEFMRIQDALWCVEYRVENQGEVSLRQRLEWHIDQFV
ncbi:MAG: DUF1934 family protein [Bulleidia sp.]